MTHAAQGVLAAPMDMMEEDRESLQAERQAAADLKAQDLLARRRVLVAEVAKLEEEHRGLAELWKQTQAEVARKMQAAEDQYAKTDSAQQELFRLRALERSLKDELTFLEDEKVGQERMLAASLETLRLNMVEVEKTVRELEFIKGELEALAQHVESIKTRVPDRVTGISHLDEKISRLTKEFGQLAERLQTTGNSVNLAYYKKKNELRRTHAPY